MKKTINLLAFTLLLSSSAFADYKQVGTSLDIVKLGSPEKCQYRAVFREYDPGRGIIRVPLNQSSFFRTSSTSLPATNHFRGQIDSDTLDELVSMQFLSREQAIDVLNLNYGGGVFQQGSISLIEKNSGGVDLQVSVSLQVRAASATQTTAVLLSPGIVSIEEECVSKRFGATLVRNRRKF